MKIDFTQFTQQQIDDMKELLAPSHRQWMGIGLGGIVNHQGNVFKYDESTKAYIQISTTLNSQPMYLIIEVHSGMRMTATHLTLDLIADAVKCDKTIDIIRLSDGKIMQEDHDNGNYKWIELGKYN